jgi:hypothetical protein
MRARLSYYREEEIMSTAAEYQAKAAEALAQLAEAKTEAERSRLRRAHSVYMKLSTHGEEAAARAAMKPAARIKPEKARVAEQPADRYGSFGPR